MGLCSMTSGQTVANYFSQDEDSMTTPDNSIWKKLPLNGGSAAAPAPAAPAAPPAAAAPAPFKFEFPTLAAKGPDEVSPAAPVIAALEGHVSPPVAAEPEKPKAKRTPKAAEPAIQISMEALAAAAELPRYQGDDPLTRIGRALIAAGKALAGE